MRHQYQSGVFTNFSLNLADRQRSIMPYWKKRLDVAMGKKLQNPRFEVIPLVASGWVKVALATTARIKPAVVPSRVSAGDADAGTMHGFDDRKCGLALRFDDQDGRAGH